MSSVTNGSNGQMKQALINNFENSRLQDGPEGEYLTDRLTDESIRFLNEAKGDPFFLFLSFYTVHTPIQGCRRFDDYYKKQKLDLPDRGKAKVRSEHRGKTRLNQTDAKYAAMVRCMDENVGRVLDTLQKLDQYENTIIVLTSDNGGLTTKSNIGPTAVTPLRAGNYPSVSNEQK